MDLMLIFDIVLGVLLVIFGVIGFARGLWPEIVTMAGVLIGGLLTEQWADLWGTDLAETAGFLDRSTSRFIIHLLLFLVPLGAIGYAGSMLLPDTGKPNTRRRLFGLLVGFANGAAILGFLLRAYQYTYNGADANTTLMSGYVSRFLLEWAGWWVLVLALGGSIAVIATIFARAGRSRPAPVVFEPEPEQQAAPSGPTPGPRPQFADGGSSGPRPPLDRPAPPRAEMTGAVPIVSSGAAPAGPPGRPVGASESKPAPSEVTSVVPVSTSSGGSGAEAQRNAGSRSEVRCRTCGKELLPGAAFCTNCGTPVE